MADFRQNLDRAQNLIGSRGRLDVRYCRCDQLLLTISSDSQTDVNVDQVVDVYKQAAFDWPLGPLGRIRQKYGKPKVPKSKSEDQLAEVGRQIKTS